MGLSKKTIAIIVAVVVLIVVGVLLGVLLSKTNKSHIELEVWPRSGDNEVQPFIQFKSGNHSSWSPWVEKINGFLKEYRRNETVTHGNKTRVICNNKTRLSENQVCNVPVEAYPNNYGYDYAAPYVFLKLNKVLDWKPQTYNMTDILQNNQSMPENLQRYIKNMPAENLVWVSCKGKNATDVDNMGPVRYIPRPGFPAYYYPFTNKEGYLSPLVAVHFEKPQTGVVINIECKAWAKNIVYENGGSVHFKLMVQ